MKIRKNVYGWFVALAMCVGSAWANLPTGVSDNESGAGEQSESGDIVEVANWVKELSNLPPEGRKAYADAFRMAKTCYAQGRMVECESHLNTCELYNRSNPNVWNLRASALIAQKQFEAAEPLLLAVRRLNPQDSVARLSLSLLYLGTNNYEKCLEETEQLIDDIMYKDMMQLTHSLMFRKLVCLVMLERMDEARDVVAEISAMDDSPLYYYSQAVFALVEGNRKQAMSDMNVADSIYKSTGYLSGYKQTFTYSGLVDKYSVGNTSVK